VSLYFSTFTFVEIRQNSLKKKGVLSVRDFFKDMASAFIPIEPNPNILIAAGELRDAEPTNPSDAKTQNKRVIGSVDAIHLMTCCYARDVLGIDGIIFHTFDEGRGKSWEGKCVPIIGFEKWFPPATRTPRVTEVCNLPRSKPIHTSPAFHRKMAPAG
jgi:hypothetical protein